MKFWSRYNHTFKHKNGQVLIFNALSNTFAEIPSEKGEYFLALCAGDEVHLDNDVMLIMQLSLMKCLVDKNEDNQLANVIRMQRRSRSNSTQSLSLTIVPTRACNFKCVYCYEQDRRGVILSEQIEDDIVTFIKRHKNLKHLSITWFGGEPLLRFDIIKRLTAKFLALEIPQYYSEIISNSYLLTPTIAQEFNELKIRNIQVTVDGPAEIHDKRRMLLNGQGSFDKIIDNIGMLLDSPYDGRVTFRINVDKTNAKYYGETHRFLRAKFPQNRVHIYPGIVHDYDESTDSHEYCFNHGEEVAFHLEQSGKNNLDTVSLFPKHRTSSCLANCKNGYVVGPKGELYKCWADIGKEEKIVGYVSPDKQWNMQLLASWLEGQNALNDESCQQCSIMPLCDGGCAYVRLKQYLEGKKIDNCNYLKEHLCDFLSEYYEMKQAHDS